MNVLTYKNNWESDEYYVDGRKISNLVKIKFDDKIINVHSNEVTVRYMDMGHSSSSTSIHYFVTCKILGTEIEIDLNQIVPKTRIEAFEFTE